MNRLAPLAAPAAAGLLLPLAFPGFLLSEGIAPAGLTALAPLFVFLSCRRRLPQVVLGYGVFALLHFGLVLYWIPEVLVNYGGLGWPAAAGIFLLLLLSQALLTAPAPLGMWWIAARSRSAALAAAPGLWLVSELLRNELPFGGFPWAALGYSQLGSLWLAQAADLGGVYSLGFVVAAVNALLAAAWIARSWRQAQAAMLLVTLLAGYGAYRCLLWEPEPVGSIRVGLVQGNLRQYADRRYYAARYFEDLPLLFDRAVAQGAEWVVLPEAQNPYRFGEDFYYTRFWRSRVEEASVWLLLNSTVRADSDQRLHNSAFLLSPDGQTVLRYDKVQLVPFGEYVPLDGFFGLVDSLVDEVADFAPGVELRLGAVGEFVIAPQICFESLFPWVSRRAVAAGGQLLVNLTNDGWYGISAAPYQHLDIARMRAIETRRMMVRSTNTGISALISPRGEVLASTPLFEEATRVGDAVFYDGSSPFVLLGQALNAILIIGTGLQAGRLWRRGAARN